MKTIQTTLKGQKRGSARVSSLIIVGLLALALASCLPGGNDGSAQKETSPADFIEHPQLAAGNKDDFVNPDGEENEPGPGLPDACAFQGPEQAGELLNQAVQEKTLTPAEREAWAAAIEANGTGWIWQCSSSVVPV